MSCASVKELNFHSNKIMPLSYDKMNSMRKHQVLCDITVRIGSKILPVHKIILASNSDYFEKMFTGSFIESNAEEITLNEIDSNAVELLIDYMYTSKLKITERNVQNILLASSFLLIEDIDGECIKFMKKSINVENCWAYKNFADTNNVVELDDFCFSFILDHFAVLTKSVGFLVQPIELITELLQSNQLNITEEKIYESIISWVKHEMKNRIEFLPGLMKFVNMSLIPVNYFMNNIENEEILKSHCNSTLYDALKMYTNNFYSGCRMPFNQLILISSWKKNRNNLEWMMTGNKIIKATKFSWTTFNSIILRDGRIFRLSYCSDDNNWYGRIYSEGQWNFVGNIKFNNGYREMLRLIELSDCIYVMSHLGYFKCYDIKKNTWEDLEGITISGDHLRGLTICDGILYCINSTSVSRFNLDTKKWTVISKNRPLLKIDYSMVCSLNGCLYEFGGMSRQDSAYLKTAMKFDLSTNTWSFIACMKYARKNAGVVAVNGLIYVIGGENCSTFEMYDPRENKWTLSDCKLSSTNHVITRAFILDSELNISPENFSKYYPEY